MKISHPLAIRCAALTMNWVLRAWRNSIDDRTEIADISSDPFLAASPNLYLLWHENIPYGATVCSGFRITALISSHRDGELMAQTLQFIGGRTIRGSTTRGGVAALRKLTRTSNESREGTPSRETKPAHVVITPDGPRGPRRIVQQGAIYLASRTALGIVPVGVHYEYAWRARSWDRMAIPRPFSRLYIHFGQRVILPDNLDRAGLNDWRPRIQQAMQTAQTAADTMPQRMIHAATARLVRPTSEQA